MTNDFLKKFLNRDDVEHALDEVGRAAKGAGLRVVLAGGIAMQFYGSDRLTVDVDVLCHSRIPGLTVTGTLSFGGWKCVDSRGTMIDVIARNDEYRDVYDAAIENASDVVGMDVALAKVEYLVVMKMQAGRRKDEDDIVSVLKAGTVDVGLTKNLVRRFLGRGLERDLDSYVQEAAWRKKEDDR